MINPKYTPSEKPTWRTPDFNPNADDTFKPYSFIKSAGISSRTQAAIRQLDKDMSGQSQQSNLPLQPQTMTPTQGMIQLPNGSFVTPEQYQKLLIKLQQR